MKVHNNLSGVSGFNNAVITIGTFDGVHTGHRQIIEQLKQEADLINGESVIITFHPHPRKIVSSKKVSVLTTLAEKTELFAHLQVDHLVVVPFNESFAHQTPEDYIQYFLFENFKPHTVIIGYDHRFGKDRQGDYHLLEDYGKKLGFEVNEIPEHVLNNVIVSSTKIRQALLTNDISTANKYLGYDYFFEGIIVKGNQLGRTLGYPTANIRINEPEKLVPGNGIYAVEVILQDEGLTKNIKPGMMSIGIRPTIEDNTRTIEVNIFDFDGDIYGKTLRVFIKKYLREEIKFNSLDELKIQLEEDKKTALSCLT